MAKNNTDPYYCLSIWPLDVPRIHLITFGISQAISSIFTIVSNLILIQALYQTNQLNTISNKFILLMSISDMCMGLIGQPMIIIMVALKDTFRNCTLEKFVEYVVFLSANFSWFMLVLISIDRYFQITKLNRYNEYMTEYRMKVAVIGSILVTNIFTLVLILSPSFTLQVILNIANIAMMTFVASIYAYMMRRLKKHDKNRRAAGLAAAESHVGNQMEHESPENNQSNIIANQMARKESRKQFSALKTIRMLIIAIFVLYGPYNIVSTYWTYYKFGKKVNPPLELNVVILWAYFIVLTNATVNACIIINGNSKARRFAMNKIQRVSPSQSKDQASSDQSSMSHALTIQQKKTLVYP